MPTQGKATAAWATRAHVVKIAQAPTGNDVATEALVAPLARAAGVRTPALVAWAHTDALAYSIWERVDGPLLDEDDDAPAWRQVGRELAKLHAIARADDARGLLRKPDKRDARPWLHALAGDRARFFARWLDALERVPPAPPRLLHYDVHGCNVIVAAAGATLIDWADAGWGDPAAEFASMPIAHVAEALAGYEEVRPLGVGGEARVLRAIVGQAVRMRAARGYGGPLEALDAWLRAGPPERFSEWLPTC